MFKSFGNKAYVAPLPLLLVGTYDDNNNPNLMTCAWGAPYDYDKLILTLEHSHKTTQNILNNKVFTITFGTLNTVNIVDYVGMVSQNKNKDKLKDLNLNIIKSSNINAPIFSDFPLTLECELISYDTNTEVMLAKIINTLVSEDYILEDGSIDASSMHLLAYNSLDKCYYDTSSKVCNAYKISKWPTKE